jgi:hypothetical protein
MAARKPFSATDVLRANSPRKTIGNTFLTVNKFNHLIDTPPSPSPGAAPAPAPAPGTDSRPRLGSVSQKRKISDGSNANSYASIASNVGSGPGTGTGSYMYANTQDENLIMEVTKIRSLLDKVDKDIGEATADISVLSILKNLQEAVSGICDGISKPANGDNIEFTKVKSMCEKVDKEITEATADGSVLTILKTLNDAISGLCTAAETAEKKRKTCPVPAPIVAAQVPAPSQYSNMVSLGVISKKQRTATAGRNINGNFRPGGGTGTGIGAGSGSTAAAYGSASAQGSRSVNTTGVPPEVQSFRDTVKNAEKSTLIFNLNLGRVPILNTDTMSKRATLALTSMAAEVEGNSKDNPSKKSIEMIDDIMSVSTGIHFYGTTTKSYRHPRDDLSGSFCTIPIRYDFDDRETRIQVEQTLRTNCNVKCSTPYPPILRECIKRVIADAKTEFPDNLIKVVVDSNNLTLKVARKVSKDDKSRWIYASEDIKLPQEALDTRSRKIPESLTIGKVKFLFLFLYLFTTTQKTWPTIFYKEYIFTLLLDYWLPS